MPTKAKLDVSGLVTDKCYQPIPVKWPAKVDNVRAISTTRQTFSPITQENQHHLNVHNILSPYNYFNLGTHVEDNLDSVEKNRIKLLSIFPANTQMQWLNQVHDNGVEYIRSHQQQAITADAVITDQKRLALTIMTADCLPILIANLNGTEIAAIHGGWRPLSKNIIINTVDKMKSDTDELIAWLGPCIGASVFEVGSEVRDVFIMMDNQFEQAFTLSKINHDKYLADLHKIALLQLKSLGIKQISQLKECTFSMADKYYSYRRENKTGRMATVISIL